MTLEIRTGLIGIPYRLCQFWLKWGQGPPGKPKLASLPSHHLLSFLSSENPLFLSSYRSWESMELAISGPWVAHLEGGSYTCGALVCDSRPQALPFSLLLPFSQPQKKIRFGGPVGVLGPQTRPDLVKEGARHQLLPWEGACVSACRETLSCGKEIRWWDLLDALSSQHLA